MGMEIENPIGDASLYKPGGDAIYGLFNLQVNKLKYFISVVKSVGFGLILSKLTLYRVNL
jgi:hypothetical protein